MVYLTADGSKTIYTERFGEHYHSTFGAVNESEHVFIRAGYLAAAAVNSVSVLEVGFGTGLNAWLTLHEAHNLQRRTYYEAIELYPVDAATISEFSNESFFRSLHIAAWEIPAEITAIFTLLKRKSDLLQTTFTRKFDIVYFDAFSPAVQPEMWSDDIFAKLYAAMNPDAILTTYCAKGDVRRTMQKAGFAVERLPGPAGKREMLRGRKTKKINSCSNGAVQVQYCGC
jgi:tRNA U34 5-methylaminomethyl-2-thiouridine-forming methyltransferase MnmC